MVSSIKNLTSRAFIITSVCATCGNSSLYEAEEACQKLNHKGSASSTDLL